MKRSIFGEYSEYTLVRLTRTHLRIRLLKLSAVRENGEWHKLEPISANYDPNNKNYNRNLLRIEYGMVKKPSHDTVPSKNVQLNKGIVRFSRKFLRVYSLEGFLLLFEISRVSIVIDYRRRVRLNNKQCRLC